MGCVLSGNCFRIKHRKSEEAKITLASQDFGFCSVNQVRIILLGMLRMIPNELLGFPFSMRQSHYYLLCSWLTSVNF